MPVIPARHEIGIVVALPAEASSLGVARWRAGRIQPSAAGCVCMAGIGLDRAAAGARQLLEQGARVLLSWGVAGALAPSLSAGDVLLPGRVASADGEWSVDASLRSRLEDALGERDSATMTLWCSGGPVTRIEDKRDLAQRNLHAVDMESAAVAAVAAEAGVPFAAIKAICDPAARALPAAAPALLHDTGRLRPRGLLGAAMGGPALWRELGQLRRDFDAAHRALCRAARRMPTGPRA